MDPPNCLTGRGAELNFTLARYQLFAQLTKSLASMEDYECIFTYLESGIYPAGLSKNEKRNLRRKCNENFKVENGQLYYRRSNRCTTQEECEWKLCIKTVEEKQRVLRSCHSSATNLPVSCIQYQCHQKYGNRLLKQLCCVYMHGMMEHF